MVVVGFDDEIEAVVWCLLVEMMDLSSVGCEGWFVEQPVPWVLALLGFGGV